MIIYDHPSVNYALAYQILKDSEPGLAGTYAQKAIDIMDGIVTGFSVGEEINGLAAIRLGESADRTINADEASSLGIICGSYKLGYSARNFGLAVPVGYDWLYKKLTGPQRQTLQAVMFTWIDWYRGRRTKYNNGVLKNGTRYYEDQDGDCTASNICTSWTGNATKGYSESSVNDNFFSGYFLMAVLASYATHGDNPDTQEYVDFALNNLYYNRVKLALTDEFYLKGGDSPEGWNYGSGYWRLMQALDAIRTSSDDPVFENFDFPKEFFKAYLHATKPNLHDIYYHGDWTGAYKGRPYEYIMLHNTHLLTELYPGSDISKMAHFYLNNVAFASDASLWEKMLWYDSSAPVESFDNEPLFYHSIGTGLVTVRSSWQNLPHSIWASIQLDNKLVSSHEHYDEGHFTIQRGNDKLVVGSAGSDIFGHNTISFGGTNQHANSTSSTHAIQHIQNTDDYFYCYGDITGAYQRKWKPSRAEKFVRQFVYLRPDWFVVFDHTRGSPDYYDKDWFISFVNEPVINTSESTIVATNADSKIFVKTLEPSGYDATTTYRSDWRGTGWRVAIEPPTIQEEDFFLQVLYPCDSSVSSMPTTSKITTTGNEMVGAFISDSTENKIALFSSDANGAAVTDQIEYTVNTSQSSRHILFDLQANTKYTATISGVGSSDVISSGYGTLMFTNDTASSHTYTIDVTAGATPGEYPAPPTDIELTTTATNAKLTWTLSADDGTEDNDVTGYKIYRSADGTTYSSIATVGSGVTTYTHSDPGGVNYYKVATVDSGGLESSLDYQTGLKAAFYPIVKTITSTTDDGYYKEGDTINVTINFSEAVTLSDGNLIITLETGETDRTITISSIDNSSTASGTYSVQAGDTSSDLTVKSLTLSSGATLRDSDGEDGDLSKINYNLSDNSDIFDIVIDTTAPGKATVLSSSSHTTSVWSNDNNRHGKLDGGHRHWRKRPGWIFHSLGHNG